jgi:CPA1 family monovalent cation:H+ antiporter
VGDLEFLFILMLVAAGLVRGAAYLHVPYPIALVLIGLAVGVIPSLPTIEIDSELVLVVFLPPLLARRASMRRRASSRPSGGRCRRW